MPGGENRWTSGDTFRAVASRRHAFPRYAGTDPPVRLRTSLHPRRKDETSSPQRRRGVVRDPRSTEKLFSSSSRASRGTCSCTSSQVVSLGRVGMTRRSQSLGQLLHGARVALIRTPNKTQSVIASDRRERGNPVGLSAANLPIPADRRRWATPSPAGVAPSLRSLE